MLRSFWEIEALEGVAILKSFQILETLEILYSGNNSGNSLRSGKNGMNGTFVNIRSWNFGKPETPEILKAVMVL